MMLVTFLFVLSLYRFLKTRSTFTALQDTARHCLSAVHGIVHAPCPFMDQFGSPSSVAINFIKLFQIQGCRLGPRAMGRSFHSVSLCIPSTSFMGTVSFVGRLIVTIVDSADAILHHYIKFAVFLPHARPSKQRLYVPDTFFLFCLVRLD